MPFLYGGAFFFDILLYLCTNNQTMTERKTIEKAMEMRPKDLAKLCGCSMHTVYKWRSLYGKGELSDWRRFRIEFLINK